MLILTPKYQYVADHLLAHHRTGVKEKDTMTKGLAQLIAEGLQLAEDYDKKNKEQQW